MSFKIIYSFILTMLGGMWDLSYQPGVEPVSSAVEMGSLNHWTARTVHSYKLSVCSFYRMSHKSQSELMYVILLILSVSSLSNKEPKATYLEILKNTVKRNSA